MSIEQVVIGHADVRANDAYNDDLSARRATNVAASLVEGGVIAQLGAEGIDSPSAAETRRVYNSPDVALFLDTAQNRRFLSINVGTGYRAHPLNQTVQVILS